MRASIIIPAWNGAPYLEACLSSVLGWLAPEHDIVIIDNGSTDGTGEIARRHASDARVRVIDNGVNMGFAHAINQGLALAPGDVLILLNQDTVSLRDWLSPVLAAIACDERIGILGCRLRYPDGRVQHAGGWVNPRGEGAHFRDDPPSDANGLTDVAFVTGACLAITRACLEEIGPLDEGFGRAYFEDVDWCYRARRAGYRVVYFGQAELIHAERSAAASDDIAGMANYHGNRLRFVVKHYSVEALSTFLADEGAWLRGLGPVGARLVAAMQRVYFRHCLGLRELTRTRAAGSGAKVTADEIDTIACALAALRAIAPLETR